jgi:hypothetical protein
MEKHELIAQISKLFVGTPAAHRQLMESLPSKSEVELERLAAKLQIQLAQREKTKLDLVRQGLTPTEANWSLIDHRLGPYFTVQQFRDSITQDPDFKQSLEWEKEPFAEIVQQEQQDAAAEQKNFALFVGAARAATARGVNKCSRKISFCQILLPRREKIITYKIRVINAPLAVKKHVMLCAKLPVNFHFFRRDCC